ncbi:hypothetical protein DXG01_005322 [Tephrocybe rancida]|nr:hypothetical protein DXG01_005322 [Tephrocybe rancida]
MPTVTSENFRAADADVIFKSCDDVLFHIHRRNVETHAGGFPSAEIDTNGEVVPLTEDSSTLEQFFRYIYPQRHPNINLLPFDVLYELAEAAEKYEFFNLMIICNARLKLVKSPSYTTELVIDVRSLSRQVLPEHPEELFNYGHKHDYPDVLDLAAPLLLDLPLDEIVLKLSPQLVVPWVRYFKTWSRAAEAALSFTPISSSRPLRNLKKLAERAEGYYKALNAMSICKTRISGIVGEHPAAVLLRQEERRQFSLSYDDSDPVVLSNAI